jgi:uncharacterized peroxidase-related enzyme
VPANQQEALLAALVSASADGISITQREQLLLSYAERLTREPTSVTAQDIAALRNIGLDDRAIHDACVIIAYYAFVNRIADGLGVELESPPPTG